MSRSVQYCTWYQNSFDIAPSYQQWLKFKTASCSPQFPIGSPAAIQGLLSLFKGLENSLDSHSLPC